MQIISCRVLSAIGFILVAASVASAQGRPAPAFEVPAGAVVFADDGTVSEGAIGASFRAYVTPRVSVGPEFLFISGQRHSHTILTGNVTFDLLRPARSRRLTTV